MVFGLAIHKGLEKAESSAAVQLQTGHIGFNQYLFRRKVPGVESPQYGCGWRYQNAKHILLFCLRYTKGRQEMLAQAGSTDYTQIISSSKGIKAAARWLVRSGALSQFAIAKDQLKERDGEASKEATQ